MLIFLEKIIHIDYQCIDHLTTLFQSKISHFSLLEISAEKVGPNLGR